MFGSFVLRFKNVSSAASCSKSRFLSTLNNPIDLEKLDVDLFRSKHLWKPSGARAVYGGQVVGQAVAASTQCVTNKKVLNSLHAYFIKGGDPDVPIIYRVRRLNTTNNFEMHSISAKQNGQTIFHCQASYHRPEESPLFHERSMPSAPDPESLISQEDQLKAMLEDPRLPDSSRLLISERLKTPFAIDVRDVTPYNIFEPDSRPPNKLVWMRTRVPLEESDSSMQQCFAAFASDWGLAGASLLPHKLYFGHPKMKLITSLDHSMWFHAPFRADQWMLLDMRSVKLAGGRGTNIGYIYNSKGELAITVAQECLIRLREKPKE